MDSDEPFDGHGDNDEDRAGVGDLGQGEEDGDHVRVQLVAVRLVDQGAGEDANVVNDAEAVEHTKHGDETSEKQFEFKNCCEDHAEGN